MRKAVTSGKTGAVDRLSVFSYQKYLNTSFTGGGMYTSVSRRFRTVEASRTNPDIINNYYLSEWIILSERGQESPKCNIIHKPKTHQPRLLPQIRYGRLVTPGNKVYPEDSIRYKPGLPWGHTQN